MIIICPGGWSDRVTHAPVRIGEKEPAADLRETHGACDLFARAMGATISCRWCGEAETANGLCPKCQLGLSTRVGAPILRLTVYRQGGVLSCQYDGAGAILRLLQAMTRPEYRSFQLDPIKMEAAR